MPALNFKYFVFYNMNIIYLLAIIIIIIISLIFTTSQNGADISNYSHLGVLVPTIVSIEDCYNNYYAFSISTT